MRNGSAGEALYHWPVVVVSLLASAGFLYWFHRLPHDRTPEESLQEAIEHQSPTWLPG